MLENCPYFLILRTGVVGFSAFERILFFFFAVVYMTLVSLNKVNL